MINKSQMNPIKAFLSSISSVNNRDAASQNEKKTAPVKGESRTSVFYTSGNNTVNNVGVPTRNSNTRSLDHYNINPKTRKAIH